MATNPLTPAPSEAPVKNENWLRKFGTDAVIIAALSAIGFAMSIFYELGYSLHFGYPHSLIEPSLATTALSLTSIFLVFILISPFMQISMAMDTPRGRAAGLNIMMVVMSVLFIAASTYLVASSSIRWIAPAMLIFTNGLLIILGKKSTNKPQRRINFLLKAILLFGISAASLILVAIACGNYFAGSQKFFYFDKSNPEYAAVRASGSTIIFVKFDFNKQKFTNEFKVRRLSDDKEGLELIRLKITAKRPRFPA